MRTLAHLLRATLALAVLAILVDRFGTAPFLAALDHVTPGTVVAALALTLLSTVCCAARWVWVAHRLGHPLDLPTALAAYYRSLLLNQTLPTGVLGDVHRAWQQRTVRSVVWERVLGQVVLVTGASATLLVLPSPLPRGPVAVAGLAALLLGAGLARWAPRAFATPDLWRPLLLSAGAIAGNVALLLVALRAVLPHAGLVTALPLLVAVLLASSLPISLAGWGPREGAAALVFGLAGLGGEAGLTVAATYGVLGLLAALPGALLLIGDAVPGRMEVKSP